MWFGKLLSCLDELTKEEFFRFIRKREKRGNFEVTNEFIAKTLFESDDPTTFSALKNFFSGEIMGINYEDWFPIERIDYRKTYLNNLLRSC